MNKKTVKDVELNGKKVLVRVDFIVPMKDGKITAEIDRNEFNEQMILTCALEENEV